MTPELASASTKLSHTLRRQIGFVINRRGVIESVIVGTDRQLVIPLLARSRSGPRLLRGVRVVHTSFTEPPLTNDDLTDLALLRLDMIVAIGVGAYGEPAQISVTHLLPSNPEGKSCAKLAPTAFHSFQLDCQQFIQSLESEIAHGTPALRTTTTRPGALLISVFARSHVEQDERLEETNALIAIRHQDPGYGQKTSVVYQSQVCPNINRCDHSSSSEWRREVDFDRDVSRKNLFLK